MRDIQQMKMKTFFREILLKFHLDIEVIFFTIEKMKS